MCLKTCKYNVYASVFLKIYMYTQYAHIHLVNNCILYIDCWYY